MDLDVWSAGPAMKNKRSHFGCTSVKDVNGNFTHVVVHGGGHLDTEILDIASLRWKEGPEIPVPIYFTVELVSANPHQTSASAYLVAGYMPQDTEGCEEVGCGRVYRLSKDFQNWSSIGNLRKHRLDFAAIGLPKGSFVTC